MWFNIKRAIVSLLRGALGPFLDRRVYTVRHGIAAGLKRRGGIGFIRRPLCREEQFIQSLDFAGKTCYDIGAYHGVFTLFFARAVGPEGHVAAFEPNPDNHAHVAENIRLNGFENVQVFPLGLGRERTMASMVFRPSERSMGSLQADLQEELRQRGDTRRITIEVDTLDHVIEAHGLPKPDFIKIDVEGLEGDVLEGMADTLERHAPSLFIEVHGAGPERKKANAHCLVNYLLPRGYAIQHVESGKSISVNNTSDAMEGHMYCTKAHANSPR